MPLGHRRSANVQVVTIAPSRHFSHSSISVQSVLQKLLVADNHKQAIATPSALPVLTAEKVQMHLPQHSAMPQITHARLVPSERLALQARTLSLVRRQLVVLRAQRVQPAATVSVMVRRRNASLDISRQPGPRAHAR